MAFELIEPTPLDGARRAPGGVEIGGTIDRVVRMNELPKRA